MVLNGGKLDLPPQMSIQSGANPLVASCDFDPWGDYP